MHANSEIFVTANINQTNSYSYLLVFIGGDNLRYLWMTFQAYSLGLLSR